MQTLEILEILKPYFREATEEEVFQALELDEETEDLMQCSDIYHKVGHIAWLLAKEWCRDKLKELGNFHVVELVEYSGDTEVAVVNNYKIYYLSPKEIAEYVGQKEG